MIKVAIFDMDGLLINSEPLWMQAEIEIFEKLGITLSVDDCKKMQGVKISDVIKHWYQIKPWQGVSLEQVEKEILARVKDLIKERGQIQKGVKKVLDFFFQKHIPMCVASSSSPELIDLVLNKLEIFDYFSFYHSSSYEKRGKPYPDIFLTTANKFGVKPQSCVVFEDSSNGVIAAKRAGMKIVAVPYPDNYNDSVFDIADIKLKSLEEWNEEKFQLLQVKV